jgi:hypothetical protein
LQTFTNKMRIISFGLIISLSLLTKGQNVFTKFQDTVLIDNFSSNQYQFPQKYNAFELFIIENNQYRLKRISEESHSVSYAKLDDRMEAFEISATIQLVKTKNKKASGGLVLHGQTIGNGAIIIEINSKKRFKISKLFENQKRYLSGSPKEKGWIKSSAISKKGKNKITLKVKDGYYDLYINNKYVFTAFDNQFVDGKIGFFINGASEMKVYDVIIKKEATGFGLATGGSSDTSNNGGISDPSFQEVILVFRTKIDQQQAEIASLQKEINQCKSMLNYDTTLLSKSSQLEIDNGLLSSKLDSTTRELTIAQKRLKYLESFKEDIENSSNGDMILNLSNILADVKIENKALSQKAAKAEAENKILKKDNEVLLREIDRLKYMLDLKD